MKQIVADFISFIRKPKDIPYSGNEKSYKWNVFFTLFALELLLLVVYYPCVILLDKYVPLEQSLDATFSAIGTFFLMVLLIPFIEEVFFRLGLRRKYVLKSIFSEQEWQRWFPFFVYSSTIVFGLVHITNYANTQWIFFALAPFIILTQLVGGFIMAYLRVRFNFWLGFLYHAVWNFTMIFVISGIVFLFFTEDTHIKTDDYELEIKEKMFESLSGSKTISYKADDDTIYFIESDQYNMGKLLEIISPDNKEYIAKPSTVVVLKFEAEKGISKDSLLILLEQEDYLRKRR